MTSNSICLSIIGGGVMAEAILSRLLAQNVFAASTVLVSEPREERRQYLTEQYQVQVTEDNQTAISASGILLLAVKPQILDLVVSNITPNTNSTVISILAGVTIAKLERAFPHQPVIRVMPNTPATVGQGMTAIAAGNQATKEDTKRAIAIFKAVGEVVEVPESSMDAVTGLSGSGPAFVALAIEALADGGVAGGLPRAIALQLATQTVLGTATLVKETGLHPGVLKDQVTSPGGTTIAGVVKLESVGFRSALIEAVKTATARSKELGK
ncbi:pyrroline-5-carboxylate reductase [Waterburya agarophytonicola K14]|uniref:Pyrroline-5-carboxylate reductase n=1 Tax=Waterburya agarophytonicola KI4 TaxID=2874699 RepID=A0A964BQS4_9CYAN|nr:pyrroline-5-carboxylate reductase [Waterburya agarophytonicola]MCC0177874.1 pyrroline-5-carboxylate reductase [Waterburya agarophytonicola KI4]